MNLPSRCLLITVLGLPGVASACPPDAATAARLLQGMPVAERGEHSSFSGTERWTDTYRGGPATLGFSPTGVEVQYATPVGDSRAAQITYITFSLGSPSGLASAARTFAGLYPRSASHVRNDCSTTSGCELAFSEQPKGMLNRADLFNGFSGDALELRCRYSH